MTDFVRFYETHDSITFLKRRVNFDLPSEKESDSAVIFD